MKAFLWSSLFLATLLSTSICRAADERDPLTVSLISGPTSWNPGQPGQLVFQISLPEKFHAYEDKFSVDVLEPDGFLKASMKVEPTIEFDDKFSKRKRIGFVGTGKLTINLEAPSHWVKNSSDMVLQIGYQACSESFCLFPIRQTLHVPIQILGALQETNAPAKPMGAAGIFSKEHLEDLLGSNKLLALFFVFLAGILTSFTPCIFPMIPITLAVIGHGSENRSRAQNFLLSLLYVVGIATTYSLMGILAATSGAVFGASLGNPWILSVICVLFFGMTLSMYGFFELQVPAFLRNSLGAKQTAPGYVGAYFSGLVAGVVASPCVGPILVVILAWVATTGSKLYGFLLLFTYAFGLGLIFLFLGVFTEFTRKLPRSGPWLEGTKFVLGTLMLGAFYYYLSLLIPIRIFDGALAVGMISIGSLVGAFAPLKGTSSLQKLRKGFAQATLYLGIGFLALSVFDLRPILNPAIVETNPSVGTVAMKWENYSEEALQKAQQEHRPVIIDFWAEWCAACHELEQLTFRDSKIITESEKFLLLRFDATKDTATLRELKSRWQIQGLPTVLFIDSTGRWHSDLSLTEFEKAGPFLSRMQKAE